MFNKNKLTKLFISMFLLLFLFSPISIMAAERGFENPDLLISAEELNSKLENENLRIIDVRNTAKYLLGHLPEAVPIWGNELENPNGWVPGLVPTAEEFAAIMQEKGINNDSEIVVYDDNNGLWASRLWWIFKYYDHHNVRLLEGGYDAWREAGFERKMLPHNPEEGNFVVNDVNNDMIITTDTIAENLENPDLLVLDARSRAEYLGEETNSGAPRMGRIPNSVHLEWIAVLDEDNKFKSAAEIKDLYLEIGAEPDLETIAVLCHTGVRATHSIFTLNLIGYENLKLHDESWVGWSNRDDLPIIRD